MAAYLRPRRGTASGSTVVLKEGEIFLDTAKSSSATTLSSWGQIYVGNNTNNINALKPFVSLPEDMVVNSGISSTGSDSDIANGKNLKTMFSAIKKLLSDHATSITNLNNDKLAKPSSAIGGAAQPIYYSSDYSSPGLKACSVDSDGSHFGDIFNNYITTNWAVEDFLDKNCRGMVTKNGWHCFYVGGYNSSGGSSSPDRFMYIISQDFSYPSVTVTSQHGNFYYADLAGKNWPTTVMVVHPVVNVYPSAYMCASYITGWTGSKFNSIRVMNGMAISTAVSMTATVVATVLTTSRITA